MYVYIYTYCFVCTYTTLYCTYTTLQSNPSRGIDADTDRYRYQRLYMNNYEGVCKNTYEYLHYVFELICFKYVQNMYMEKD